MRAFYSEFLLLIHLAYAQPIPQRLSADSIAIFTDPRVDYPKLHDALHSLCRNVADLHRSYELDNTYRTKDMRQLVVGTNLDAACGKYPLV